MSSITATLQPSTDGSIRLYVPSELRDAGMLRVVAWIEPDATAAEKSGAGQWARGARGIAKGRETGESSADSRFSSLKQKFGI